jgi:hypothetical protein
MYAALALAFYNTYLLKQKILKNAIHLTKSNKPHIVMSASAVVSVSYFMGLFAVWLIPSFFSEIAVRIYCST